MTTEKSRVETLATLCGQRSVKKMVHGGADTPERQSKSKHNKGLGEVNSTGRRFEKDADERGQMFVKRSSSSGAHLAEEPNREIVIETENEKDDSAAENSIEGIEEDLFHPTAFLCLKSGNQNERVTVQQEEEEEKDTIGNDIVCGKNDWSSRSSSDDYENDDDNSVTLLISTECVPCVTEDESQYITTHEIQLAELSDNEGDCDLGVGSEDSKQVCPFGDSASFDGKVAAGERGAQGEVAAVSSLRESDPSDSAKFRSSEGNGSRPQKQHCSGASAGQIHLSIRTTSRAINGPGNIQEEGNIFYHATRSGDTSRYVFRGVDGKGEAVGDMAKCFIAVPGRFHFGSKLRRKEVIDYSSGASSAVSEPDDADKEVRSLTAQTFKSLAYPYFDVINLSTSSESSASERGIGIKRWSTFVDLKYGNMNLSRGQSIQQNSTASLQIAKDVANRGYKGITRVPSDKIFSLNANPHSASSSKQIDMMEQFSQGHGEMIRLTETLNFSCNIKSGISVRERRMNFAQNAAGSRSVDEVTDTLPGGQRSGARQTPSKTMDDTHTKAIFASSLIKNVISKKMQFEQERKMERGEISEPHHASSSCFAHQESDDHRVKGSRELHRQSSKFSQNISEDVMCVDEFRDIVDSGSFNTNNDSRAQEATAPAPANLETGNEAGNDTKQGTLNASKSTLLRSQKSAFRCWKDEELEFQRDHKNDETPVDKSLSTRIREGEPDYYSRCGGKLTKMSHLFVPSFQLLPSDGEVGQHLESKGSSCMESGEIQLRSNNNFYVADSRNVPTSKSPEIKINLKSVRNNKTELFGVSKLRAPDLGSNTNSLIRADDFKCQMLAAALKGESSDKVPHFTVRDFRDNKAKLQTPIHQVRDVRKLVKSSYHFVSLDNNERKSKFSTADSFSEQNKHIFCRNPNSVSPIVIKCQSVNTNNGKQPGTFADHRAQCDIDRSSPEGAKSTSLLRVPRKVPISTPFNTSEADIGVRTESRIAPKRQDKIPDAPDKKPESKMANQMALEKLQAAVKTMEQLYVFEKNEWKRKGEPQPLMDSHVLSLIACEEHEGLEEDGMGGLDMEKTSTAAMLSSATDTLSQSTGSCDEWLAAKTIQASSSTIGSLSSHIQTSPATKMTQPNTITQTPFGSKSFLPKSPVLPVSVRNCQTRLSGHEGAQFKESDKPTQELLGGLADNEYYLTIPVQFHASNDTQVSSPERTSVVTFTTQTQSKTLSRSLGTSSRGQEDLNQTPKHSSTVMNTCSPETASATIYHSLPLGMAASQPQLYCFSPAVTPAPPLDPFQATQRKMLLDPTTGSYYLVDTPVQPATKRLFDPETGQYVDVPMPQAPTTPVPMPISSLALSPGAYGHTYMIYPGFMPTPSVIPACTLAQSQMSKHSETKNAEKDPLQQAGGMYIDSPFYMTAGKSTQGASGAQQAASNRPLQPVISITSQQCPRIIAPPSFDGTTMSFVVEHS